jgi:hypothetical protein
VLAEAQQPPPSTIAMSNRFLQLRQYLEGVIGNTAFGRIENWRTPRSGQAPKSFASTRELADAIIAFLAAGQRQSAALCLESQGRRDPAQDECRRTGARRPPVAK